jgi:hypothetical protein
VKCLPTARPKKSLFFLPGFLSRSCMARREHFLVDEGLAALVLRRTADEKRHPQAGVPYVVPLVALGDV